VLALLKFIQSLVKTLHSEGTPGQIAAGLALGAALGLTPLMSLQNLLIFGALFLLNVSFGSGMLGWALATPLGFLFDPAFDALGRALLESPSLRSFWTALTNAPLVPYTNFNNTVTLGSFVVWAVLSIPLYFAARAGVLHYRAKYAARFQQSRFWKALSASQAYNVYRWFRPE
jgi:uncharacterized protein (TIGR03546 family)